MPKIDTSKIEGFSDMTAEQKLAALESYDIPEPDYSGYVKKDVYDKAASEAASWKKKHNDLLSDEDKKKQEQDERVSSMEKELAELREAKKVSEYKAKFIAQGYDEALAEDTAKALADGDTAKMFANQQQFLENHAKQVKAEALKKTPRPGAGVGSEGVDYAKKAAEAQSLGNYAEAAYYTRLQAQAESK